MKKIICILILLSSSICFANQTVVFKIDNTTTTEVMVGFGSNLEHFFWLNSNIAKPYYQGPGSVVHSYNEQTVFKIVQTKKKVKYFINSILIGTESCLVSDKKRLRIVGDGEVLILRYIRSAN